MAYLLGGVIIKIAKYGLKKTEGDTPLALVCENMLCCPNKNLLEPAQAYGFFKDVFEINNLPEEYVFMAALNARLKPIGIFEISHGSYNSSIITCREILVRALLCGACYMIICHNHPSGDVTPTQKDIEATKRMSEACEIINIPLIDHIIAGNNNYLSFREIGYLTPCDSVMAV